MKKNNMMRIASVLLVAVLLSTCVSSGTFAKYVTSATSTDTARVAKFGVVITANGTTFADNYDTDDEDVVATIAKSVVTAGDAGDSVVAPGTEGDMNAMTISGTPEVAVNVAYDATLTLANWTVGNDFYCPIIITVGNNNFNGTDYDSPDLFAAAVEAAIEGYSANYAAGTNLATAVAPVVSWSWPFEGEDVEDTALGDAETAATITLTIVTTVTQID